MCMLPLAFKNNGHACFNHFLKFNSLSKKQYSSVTTSLSVTKVEITPKFRVSKLCPHA